MIQKIVKQQELVRENETLRKALRRDYRFSDMVSKSAPMQSVFELAQDGRAEPVDDPHPRRERHGQGAARSRHPRREPAPGCAVRGGVLRGAHRDAPRERAVRPREGRVHGRARGADAARSRRRDGGTLFLDEIGDISPKLQVELLRVLESAPVLPRRRQRADRPWTCGSSPPPTATCSRRCTDGQFREDLFYRLNVIPIKLPPLRERREDIPLLVEHFLERMSRASSDAASMACRATAWPC